MHVTISIPMLYCQVLILRFMTMPNLQHTQWRDWKDFHKRVKPGDFIVAGKNFGCGSSREHAPIALSYSGIKAVLALSFARIFYRNAVDGAFLLPIEIDESAYKDISDSDSLEVNIAANEIKNLTKNKVYKMKPFPELIGKIIEAGGLFNYKP